METEDLLIEQINIGERSREDYGDVEELIASIKTYGLIQPITVDSKYNLIAGGRRLLAMTAIGATRISAIVRASDKLDSLEVELIENIHRKDLTWQERAKLEKTIYDLKGKDIGGIRGVADLLGSSRSSVHDHIQMAEAMEILPDLAKHKNEDDAWKALQKLQEEMAVREVIKRAKARAADSDGVDSAITWGDSSYIITDVIEGLSELRNETYDFAEIDPPYGIDLKQLKRGKSGVGSDLENYTEFEEAEGYSYENFLYEVLHNTHSVLAKDSFCIIWFGHTHYRSVYDIFVQAGFKVNEVPGVWYKGAQGQTQQPQIHLANCYEQFLVGRKGDPILCKQGRSNVFHFAPVPGARKIHPTERPIELMDEILETFTYPDQHVLVPFAGSGVTLRSAHSANKECIGFDVSKEFKNKFLLSLEESTNEDAPDENSEE